MFLNIKRDYDKPLKKQIKEYTDQQYEYIGCFGSGSNRILKFLKVEK